MPRALTGAKVYKYLTGAEKFVIASGGGDTTVAATATAGVTAISVGATTSFASGDWVAIVGAAQSELAQIGTPAATMPLTNYRTGGAYAVGDRFVEMSRIQLGHIDGLQITGKLDLTPIRADTSRVPIAYIGNNGELMAQWNFKEFTPLNLQAALGITEAEYGAGTTADPYAMLASGATLGSQGYQSFRFTGVQVNGKTAELYLNDATTEVDFSAAIGGTQGTVVPIKIRYTSLVMREF